MTNLVKSVELRGREFLSLSFLHQKKIQATTSFFLPSNLGHNRPIFVVGDRMIPFVSVV